MRNFKDLSMFMFGKKSSSNEPFKHYHEIITVQGHQFGKRKYDQSENGKKNEQANNLRLSSKMVLNQINDCTRLKRRISTAEMSKRFPKDFFKIEAKQQKKFKSPNITFRTKKNAEDLLNEKKTKKPLRILHRKKDSQVNQTYQHTPKFNDPGECHEKLKTKDQKNQFLVLEQAPKFVLPLLSMDNERRRHTRIQRKQGKENKRVFTCDHNKDKNVDQSFRIRRINDIKQL